MARGKFTVVAERLIKRIRSGDYHAHGIPAERDLAKEIGVSRMTARKALQKLLDDGLVCRLPNGRIDVMDSDRISDSKTKLQVALLAPAWDSGETNEIHIEMSLAADRLNISPRLVYFVHPDDPVIRNTLNRFDCTFILPPDMDGKMVAELKRTENPFFIINNDWSSYGVPSIMLFPPVFVRKVLDHLASLGHREIDCFNIQPSSTVIPGRIAQWRAWIRENGLKGELYDEPVKNFSDPVAGAYKCIDQKIREGKFKSKALYCVSSPAAFGAMSAMIDHGIRPGKDVAVCTSDSGASCEFCNPSLTSMESVDVLPFLEICVKWTRGGSRKWRRPLLLQPEDIGVVVRQSTVPGMERNISGGSLRGKEAG